MLAYLSLNNELITGEFVDKRSIKLVFGGAYTITSIVGVAYPTGVYRSASSHSPSLAHLPTPRSERSD